VAVPVALGLVWVVPARSAGAALRRVYRRPWAAVERAAAAAPGKRPVAAAAQSS